MTERPKWFDGGLAIVFALLVAWAAKDVYLKDGLSKHLLFAAFFGALPVIFVFVLKLQLEAFVAFLFWSLAAFGLYQGFTDGVTFFPAKDVTPDVLWQESPAAFVIIMAINGSIVVAGLYLAFKTWKDRREG